MKSFKKSGTKLTASLNAVIAHFHQLPNNNRVNNIVERVTSLSEDEVEKSLNGVINEFEHRHREVKELLMDNFHRTEKIHGDLSHYSANRKLLLGSFLTKEYSIQSAALFNPSIVPHPDQNGLQKDEQRFIISLRATGEGHISSIIFQSGVVDKQGTVTLDKPSGYFTVLKKESNEVYTKEFVQKRMTSGFNKNLLDLLPSQFTAAEAQSIFKNQVQDDSNKDSISVLEDILDTNYSLASSTGIPIAEKVIFPSARCERMGMEDLRLVKFENGENVCYYGTYTAYDGKQIRPQLLETTDFNQFKIRTFYGNAVNDKGMSLFPEKIGGKFVMISRQGSEMISIMKSDDMYHWENFELLLEPQFDWEFVQIGNCGSPIKTDKGWLLLTHGVGAMRKYVISAILLDLQDPSKIIGRLERPMITAEGEEREGYVPNVVYTCGLLRHGKLLIIPYAVSDTATVFASIELDEVLNEMKPYKKNDRF
jgi:predicted GH43/DUF377 family glycosyl hydrolase